MTSQVSHSERQTFYSDLHGPQGLAHCCLSDLIPFYSPPLSLPSSHTGHLMPLIMPLHGTFVILFPVPDEFYPQVSTRWGPSLPQFECHFWQALP